jgi:signal transduction histidine kinase
MAQTERPTIDGFPRTLGRGAAGDELALCQSRLSSFDVAGGLAQPIVESGQQVREEFSALAETLCSAARSMSSIQVSGGLVPATAAEDLSPAAEDSTPTAGRVQLSEPAKRPLPDKKIRKRHSLAKEQLAKKIEELARSNAELQQFAYVTSHDLQEPLRMVANYTQLLAERYAGKLDVQADKYIHYAVEGTVRMQALIQDLLAFSRADGGLGNEPKITNCKGLVGQVLENLHVMIQDSGATVNCDNLPLVMARPSQLLQVFQNLIGNAIKFHGAAPPVVQISARKEKGKWAFSVTDNGIDIAPENTEIIFAIFQRLHSRIEYAGNGIGLAICKKIVEQQGGRIWVEPQTAHGATFKFTWPALLHHAKQEKAYESHH